MADKNAEYRPARRPGPDCPTCNGWLWINGQWVATRETVGLICTSCGHDYAEASHGE